jgi:hypothetical protein
MLKECFEELQKELLSQIRAHYGERLVSVVIFGSVARGTYRFDSDVDLLVVARDLPQGRIKRIREFEDVEEKLEPLLRSLREEGINTYISALIKTPEEVEQGSPILLDMVEDARILHDRKDFFQKRLQTLKKRLKELGARRVWRGNAWYWILKPDYKPGEVFEI